jgi:hypothetical protein
MPKPLFQKRHYKRIIKLLRGDFHKLVLKSELGNKRIELLDPKELLEKVIEMFEEDNKGFNKEKFLAELCKKEDK